MKEILDVIKFYEEDLKRNEERITKKYYEWIDSELNEEVHTEYKILIAQNCEKELFIASLKRLVEERKEVKL